MKRLIVMLCLLLACATLFCSCGNSIVSAAVNNDGHLILTMDNGTTMDAGNVKGAQGEKGDKGDAGIAGTKKECQHTFEEWERYEDRILVRVCVKCYALDWKLDVEDDANDPGESTSIKIGLSGPLTGAAAIYGIGVANAARMAVDEINAAGGLNGIKFELKAMDDAHDPTKVAANYAVLMDWGMQVSLGCVTTTPCLEFAHIADQDGLFFLTPTASADAVIANSNNGYQMCISDNRQGIAAAEHFNNLGISKIGVFYKSDDAYSMGILEEFKKNLKSGIETVEASFTEQTSSDFTTQVTALKDCEFIFMPIYYTPAALFMTQAKNVAGIKTYYGCDGFDGIDTSAEGFDITTIPQKVVMFTDMDIMATDGMPKEFIDRYAARYGQETLTRYAALAYDSVYAIYGALKAAANAGAQITPDTTVSQMCTILQTQFDGDYVFHGVTGKGTVSWTDGFANKAFIEQVLNPGVQ